MSALLFRPSSSSAWLSASSRAAPSSSPPSRARTNRSIYEAIRETYDGPLSTATDLMVWNATKDEITECMAIVTDDAWAVPGPNRQPPPVPGKPNPLTEAMISGRWNTSDVEKKMLDEWRDQHGLHDVDWRKPGK